MLRLEADRLIDGLGGRLRAPGVLEIEEDRIAAVGNGRGSSPAGPGRPPDDAGLVLSLPGCTLLPGLIDFHSHVGIDTRRGDLSGQVQVSPARYLAGGLELLQVDLRAGVTTVRLCGDLHGADLALRRAAGEGRVACPRLLAAGRAFRSPRCRGGAIASVFTDDPEEIGRAVAQNLDRGVDFIKLFISDGVGDPSVEPTACYYSEAHVAAATRLAHAAGRPVAAHLLGGDGVAAAAGGGLDVIEHGWFLSNADLDLVARRNILLTLTLGVLCGPRGHAFGEAPAQLARLRHLGTAACETARKVIARRLRYVLGTDAVHGCLADELRWAVTLGESPGRAIQAATAWPAAALGLQDCLGTLEAGKIADAIAVEGNPGEDIEAMTRVRLVILGGRVVWAAGAADRPGG